MKGSSGPKRASTRQAAGDPREEAALFAFLNSQPAGEFTPRSVPDLHPPQITSINATAVSVGKVQVSNIGTAFWPNIRGRGQHRIQLGGVFALNGGLGQGIGGKVLPGGWSGPEGK